MGKRGAKSYEEQSVTGGAALVPVRIIAKREGCCERTAQAALNRAVKKLCGVGSRTKQGRLMQQIVIETIHGVAADEYDPLQPSSLECLVARGAYVP